MTAKNSTTAAAPSVDTSAVAAEASKSLTTKMGTAADALPIWVALHKAEDPNSDIALLWASPVRDIKTGKLIRPEVDYTSVANFCAVTGLSASGVAASLDKLDNVRAPITRPYAGRTRLYHIEDLVRASEQVGAAKTKGSYRRAIFALTLDGDNVTGISNLADADLDAISKLLANNGYGHITLALGWRGASEVNKLLKAHKAVKRADLQTISADAEQAANNSADS